MDRLHYEINDKTGFMRVTSILLSAPCWPCSDRRHNPTVSVITDNDTNGSIFCVFFQAFS
jgi:hypothetical protein